MIEQENIRKLPDRRIAIRVKPAAEKALKQGHPWLFDQSIVRQSHEGSAGDLAVIFDQRNRFLAIGLYDPNSPIRVRVLQHGEPAAIDLAWLKNRLLAADSIRSFLKGTQTTGYRLVHGENDRLPGLVIDRYEKTYVIKLDTVAWIPHLAMVADALNRIANVQRMILRFSRKAGEQAESSYGMQDGQLIMGSPLQGEVYFRENGIRFAADVINGQKTGFFMDQRENRARLESIVASNPRLTRMLNVFAYTGAFSLYGARGGLESITDVDANAAALATAKTNFKLNQEDPAISAAEHMIVVGDAFQTLRELQGRGVKYHMVVLDPPSFAKRQLEVSRALEAYHRLALMALAVLQKNGVLIAASCSSRVSNQDFFKTVHSAANSCNRPLRELARTGHPSDHPVGFPQGAYLKCLFAIAG